MILVRKYHNSIGEPSDFDIDGSLKDTKISYFQGVEVVQKLQAALPELGVALIHLEFSNQHTTNRYGTCFSKQRRIVCYPSGQNLKTLLHELGHIASPPIRRNGYWEKHGVAFKNICRKIEKVWKQSGNSISFPKVQPIVQTVVSFPKAADTTFKSKTDILFNEDHKQWEAENPTKKEREELCKLGWSWDRNHQVWNTKDDEIAFKGMELVG